jgi:hypothetical protein
MQLIGVGFDHIVACGLSAHGISGPWWLVGWKSLSLSQTSSLTRPPFLSITHLGSRFGTIKWKKERPGA